ncbi:MAG TPA: BBE domain-containing protein [Streptosporangiaceae bacterium]
MNARFAGTPDYVRVVGSAGQVEQALADALSAGKRVAARSGGHCFENFWTSSAIKAEIDLSAMNAIYFDPAVKAFVVEPGARLRDVNNALFIDYGVSLPAGVCLDVGVGGHFCGGGYGVLARLNGIVPDHMYGVEVVTVDKTKTPRTVVATREAGDPNQDLFWAHTGGGGGNFGIVTRYLMRTPGTTGSDPSTLLPKPPAQQRVVTYTWPWPTSLQTFTAIVKGYLQWHQENSQPGSRFAGLFAQLSCLTVSSSPVIPLEIVVDPTVHGSDKLVDDFVSAVVDPVTPAATLAGDQTFPWLQFTESYGPADSGSLVGLRNKSKGSYMRESYTDAQIATMFRFLTDTSISSSRAGVLFGGYGCQVNTIAPDATAVPQRDSMNKPIYTVYWDDASQDDLYLSWIRHLYQQVHATTGGVPTLNGISDGSYINYPDIDMADPAWNTSGVPWHTLYYKDNYPRLQEIKAKWDPHNVFHHALSVQPPS